MPLTLDLVHSLCLPLGPLFLPSQAFLHLSYPRCSGPPVSGEREELPFSSLTQDPCQSCPLTLQPHLNDT